MKAKPSIFFMVGALVAVLLIVGSVLLLVTSVRQTAKTQRQLNSKRSELDRIYKREPFPSKENVQRELANTTVLREWYGKLVNEAGKGQLEPEERSPSTFMSLLGQTQRTLIAESKGGGRLPEDFAFGFDTYFGASSRLPDPKHVPRLTQQLKIVEGLCRMLFAENVTSIKAIRRDQFEAPTDGAAPEPAPKGKKDAAPAVDVNGIPEGALYGKLHFSIDFEVRESSLLAILNQLARHDLFMVVTRVEVTKQMDDVPKAVRPEPAAVAAPAVAGAPALAPEPLRRQERLICGVAVESPMLVTLDLDVFQFKGVTR